MKFVPQETLRDFSCTKSLFYLGDHHLVPEPSLRIQYQAQAIARLDCHDSGSYFLQLPALSSNTSEPFALPIHSNIKFTQSPFHYWKNDSQIVGCAILPTSEAALEEHTRETYNQLFSIATGFHLYRVWAWIPKINEVPTGRIENYRSFCLGRAQAFKEHFGELAESRMPAASGVGIQGNQLVIVFVGGTAPPEHRENPRQTPAYQYSPLYSPQPPSFARATYVPNGHSAPRHLFISGTAAILASESQFPGDIIGQLATTVENLKLMGVASYNAQRFFRIYLRDLSQTKVARDYLQAHLLDESDRVIYTENDICRQELLVEIEANLIW